MHPAHTPRTPQPARHPTRLPSLLSPRPFHLSHAKTLTQSQSHPHLTHTHTPTHHHITHTPPTPTPTPLHPPPPPPPTHTDTPTHRHTDTPTHSPTHPPTDALGLSLHALPAPQFTSDVVSWHPLSTPYFSTTILFSLLLEQSAPSLFRRRW